MAGQLNVLTAQVDRHRVNALLKLMLRDDVIVDDGNDAGRVHRMPQGLVLRQTARQERRP